MSTLHGAISNSIAIKRQIQQRIDSELKYNPGLDIEQRHTELMNDIRQRSHVEIQSEDDDCWQRNWKCGVPSQSWAKTIAVIDIVKGTFGLIFAAYLAVSIFRLMAQTPDFEMLKRRMSRTHFIFIFAIGRTGWGVALFICGLACWNFFLIVFGKLLFHAATVRNLSRLRVWYTYCFVGILISLGLYVRMWLTSSECSENYLCREQQFEYWNVWIVIKLTYLFLFIPTAYTLAVVQSLCKELTPPKSRPTSLTRRRRHPSEQQLQQQQLQQQLSQQSQQLLPQQQQHQHHNNQHPHHHQQLTLTRSQQLLQYQNQQQQQHHYHHESLHAISMDFAHINI